MNNRELSKIAINFIEIQDELRDNGAMINAAIVLQSSWRSVLARRRWKKMKTGFCKLQVLYKKKLNFKQNSAESRMKTAELEFEKRFEELVRKRRKQEQIYNELADASAEKFFYSFPIPSRLSKPESASTKIPVGGSDWKEASAALKIQYAVRKWLNRKANSPTWTRALLQHHVSEDRATSLQYDIEAWQFRNKVPSLKQEQLMELHQRAQFKFAKYQQSVVRKRINLHRIKSTLGQTKAIISLLEDKPSLDDYDLKIHAAKFHSLPLTIATKARIEHNRSMERLKQSRIRKILDD